jgi:hypothetical protein
MRSGIATIPLDYGRCPSWLFEKMKRLSRAIVLVIVEEFGTEEILKRFADPVWFQSLACVIGFDWNSSGATTTTLAALKEGLRGLENEVGIFICGGKGKTSRKTPQHIQKWAESLGWSSEKIDKLIYSSKITAKVDSSLIQANYQIYHHNFIFTKSGQWSVIQQGMNTQLQSARRYHWLSANIKDFTQEPHSGIITQVKLNPLNLIAPQSKKNKEISLELIRETPKTFWKDFQAISQKDDLLIKHTRSLGFTEMELNNIEFHWHPVLKEKFDLPRLKKIIDKAHFLKPKNFEELLAMEGVGPKTIRALSLVSEIVYGAKPSYEDPARYSFAVGGKDGTPFFVQKGIYDELLSVMEKGIKQAKIENKEKISALARLKNLATKN